MKLNGDVLVVCPKEKIKNLSISKNTTVVTDKDGTSCTFELKEDKWNAVSIKFKPKKRRFRHVHKRSFKNKQKY